MGLLPSATTRTTGATITAASFNSDFGALKSWADVYPLLTDANRTVTGVLTFSTSPVFSAAVTFALGVTVTAGGLTVTAGGLTVTAGASTFGAGITVTGTVAATAVTGDGSGLTALPAANLTGTLGAMNGSNLTNLNGTAIATGTVAAARLPTSYTNLTVTSLSTTSINPPSLAYPLLNMSSTAAALFEFDTDADTTFIDTTAPAGASKYLVVSVDGVAYRILMKAA